MNYRHAYHAGNFADVLKHAALVAVLLHLRKKESAFAVIDTPGGRGLYDLTSIGAEKTGEAREGIGRLLQERTFPGVLDPYCEIVRGGGEGRYPGSPLIAASLLRQQDRLVAVEKLPEEHAALSAALAQTKQARVILGDGYRELARLLPPRERRGLVLIDPPFEDGEEFRTAAREIIEAHRRFATGIILFWYPAKGKVSLDAAAGEMLNAGISSLLKIELDVGGDAARAGEGRTPRLTAAGLLVVNPPFRFEEEMKPVLLFLTERLAQSKNASFTLEWLAGNDLR
jgi:23S rRNA (adenine2030-N6)-methyltransferase